MTTADVYSDPSERPTVPALRSDIVRAVTKRIEQLEAEGTPYDLDELIATAKEQLQ